MLVADDLAGLVGLDRGPLADHVDLLVGQVGEKRQVADLLVHRPPLVFLLDLFFVIGVFLDLLEDVAEDFEHVAIAGGNDGG